MVVEKVVIWVWINVVVCWQYKIGYVSWVGGWVLGELIKMMLVVLQFVFVCFMVCELKKVYILYVINVDIQFYDGEEGVWCLVQEFLFNVMIVLECEMFGKKLGEGNVKLFVFDVIFVMLVVVSMSGLVIL